MDRRQFLRAVAAGAVASAASSACAADADAAYDLQALAQPELLDLLGVEHVREIGVRYRETVPAEADAEALRAAILEARPWTARLPWSPPVPVAELIQRDFTEGRTVVVQGWVLSATEARQCALFSLLRA